LTIIAEEFQNRGIEFHFASVRSQVYSLLDVDGVIQTTGAENIHAIMSDAVTYYKKKFR
jgi:hypothetical protein